MPPELVPLALVMVLGLGGKNPYSPDYPNSVVSRDPEIPFARILFDSFRFMSSIISCLLLAWILLRLELITLIMD